MLLTFSIALLFACSSGSSDDDAPDAGAGGDTSAAGTASSEHDASGGSKRDASGGSGGDGEKQSQEGDASGGSGSGGEKQIEERGEIPTHDHCEQFDGSIDPIFCFQCCLETFEGLIPDLSEKACLCESPRPCGDLCDASHCGEKLDLRKETAECRKCRLKISREKTCGKEARCKADPYCAAYAQCEADCAD